MRQRGGCVARAIAPPLSSAVGKSSSLDPNEGLTVRVSGCHVLRRLCGLGCAHELAVQGVAVLLVDVLPPGEAPASSAAAGLLDPLSPKGRIMWRGEEVRKLATRKGV